VFGDSVLSLRLPSILAMAAAVAVTGELGQRLLGPARNTSIQGQDGGRRSGTRVAFDPRGRTRYRVNPHALRPKQETTGW
jgi:hypothetical protein